MRQPKVHAWTKRNAFAVKGNDFAVCVVFAIMNGDARMR
jgi:hypothetical protein